MARRTRFDRNSVKRLERKFQAMPRVVRAALAETLEDNAEMLNELQRRYVPEDTGDLRRSIGWRWTRNSKGTNHLSITVFAGKSQKKGPRSFYARFVEFGTNPSAKRAHGVTARPFFFPPYRMSKRRMKNRVSRAQSHAIKRFVNRG